MEIVPDPQMISRTSSDRVSPFWLAQNPGQKPSSHQIPLIWPTHCYPSPSHSPALVPAKVHRCAAVARPPHFYSGSLHPAVRVRGHPNPSMPCLCSEPPGAPHDLKVKFQRISRP